MKTPLPLSGTGVTPSWYEPRFASRAPGFGSVPRKSCWRFWTSGSQEPPHELPEAGAGFQSHSHHGHDGEWKAQGTAQQRWPGERAGASVEGSWWYLGRLWRDGRLSADPQDPGKGKRG